MAKSVRLTLTENMSEKDKNREKEGEKMEKEKQKQRLKKDLTRKTECANYNFYSATDLKLVVYTYKYTTELNRSTNLKKLKQKKIEAEPRSNATWEEILSGDFDDGICIENLIDACIACHRFLFSSAVSSKNNATRKAVESLVDEERKPSDIIKAIHGIKKDPWPDRKKYRSFAHIAKGFDRWLTLFNEPENPALPGGYGEWRDEGYATEEEWIEGRDEIIIEGGDSWKN